MNGHPHPSASCGPSCVTSVFLFYLWAKSAENFCLGNYRSFCVHSTIDCGLNNVVAIIHRHLKRSLFFHYQTICLSASVVVVVQSSILCKIWFSLVWLNIGNLPARVGTEQFHFRKHFRKKYNPEAENRGFPFMLQRQKNICASNQSVFL